ncbi:MAG: AAA family ATPase, partial [Patescibacteria group bacterium]
PENIKFGTRMARSFARETLKSRPDAVQEDTAPFLERDEASQAELFFQLHSLVAERRDIGDTMRAYEKGEGEKQQSTHVIKVLNGRRIRVPAREGATTQTHRAEAMAQAQKRQKEIEKEFAKLGAIPGMTEAYEKKLTKFYFLMKTARETEALRNRNAEIDTLVDSIRKTAARGRTGVVRGVEREQLTQLEQEKNGNEEKITALEEYEGGHLLQRFLHIRDYADAAARGCMVEFPSAHEIVEEGLEHMRNHQPFLLAGHLGSGKTELARHMAKLFMIENGVGYDPEKEQDFDKLYDRLEPEFFSGAEEASVYDLVGKLKLVGKDASNPLEVNKRALAMAEELRRTGHDLPHAEIVRVLLGKSDVVETIFSYGPLGRAIRDGKPLIIDEINLIPPDVLGRINQILLRGIGSQERLQENGEEAFTIKPGFTVLSTCNLGHQYSGIKEVNAAFKSRWIAKEVEYPSIEETYDLMLAALVRKDRVRLPPDFPPEAFDKLVDLALVTREIQEIFSGRTEGQRFMAFAHGVSAEKSQLEKAVVSTRDLMRKIITVWREKNFTESLDTIIARNILAAEVFSLDDQKFMAELFIRRGFFVGWKENQFKEMNVASISAKELDALQAATGTDDYKNANSVFDKLREQAHAQASLMRDELLIGTKAHTS